MAAAEARAAWQRTANRCFVQEDAKRAPKLACCPSSGATTKQVDSGHASATDGQDYRVPGFVPHNNPPSYVNLPPETKWWLQLQPNYGNQRGLLNDQVNTFEAEMDICGAGFASLNVKTSRVPLNNVGTLVTRNLNSEPNCGTDGRVCASFIKKEYSVNKQELKAEYAKTVQEPMKMKDGKESYEFIDMDHLDEASLNTSEEWCLDSGSPLIRSEKKDPWWKTADSDELASFVAQRSFDIVENCDLPQPQANHTKRDLNDRIGFPDLGRSINSVDRNPQIVDRSNRSSYRSGGSTPQSASGSNCSVEGNSKSGLDSPLSYKTTRFGKAETHISDKDACKAQLLEALRHSQTRAREAEMAAKQAYAEKEHVVKLFFRQASEFFAYKQWFQLLQLENLYYQIKNNKNHPMSDIFPSVLPWMPIKNRKMRKKAVKGKRSKQGRPRCNVPNYTLMFALGLSLVGAGLFLGWTIGWMFPALLA